MEISRKVFLFRSKREFCGQRVREDGVRPVARNAACVAVSPLAVVGVHLLERFLPLDDEKGLADESVDDVPGERLLEVLLAQVAVLRDLRGLERLVPARPREVFAPRVEAAAALPDLENRAAHAP